MMEKVDLSALELTERVVQINRVSKVKKGGKRLHFSAVVVVGDGVRHVGVGLGKANEVADAVRKGTECARKEIVRIELNGRTIPYEVRSKWGASLIFMKPASPGTGVIACEPVRAVLELAGVKDVLTKSLGSNTINNLVRATMKGLLQMKELRKAIELRRTVI
ncbi:30S ribosomal protein S5 [candidate division TA06 bacterium]|nr:30S ribosomal protein S5 [candidate division TA06 bacterium]